MSRHVVVPGIFCGFPVGMLRYPVINRIFDACATLEAFTRIAAQRQPEAAK